MLQPKPKFNPNQPFKAVNEAKPKFNPDLPFDELKKKRFFGIKHTSATENKYYGITFGRWFIGYAETY